MKKNAIFLAILLCFPSFVRAEEKPHNPFDPEKHDPEVLYKIKDHMMQMSYDWIDLQIMTSQNAVNHSEIQNTLSSMEKNAKKIKSLNKNKELDGYMVTLIGRMQLMKQNNKQKDMTTLKQNLNHMSDTCFKCHSTNAFPAENDNK